MGRMPSISTPDRMGTSFYLPAPSVETNAYLFSGSATVAAVATPGMPGALRYTANGSAPTRTSMVYTGPITVTKPARVVFALCDRVGRSGRVHDGYMFARQELRGSESVAGWESSYFEGEWEKVPDFFEAQGFEIRSG